VVIVSNRVNVVRGDQSAQGGLAVAVEAALKDRGGLWFGWSGKTEEKPSPDATLTTVGKITYAQLDLSPQDYDEYYAGYANRTLWPLFHYMLERTNFENRSKVGYRRVNRNFAEGLSPLLEPDDIIWVHDYHLIPLARELRRLGHENRIGFFLHIPWPSLEVFLALPDHRDLMDMMCEYDLIGFQTRSDVRSFRDYVTREVGGRVNPDGEAYLGGQYFQIGAFPIQIDTDNIVDFALEAEKSEEQRRFMASLHGRKVIIGVDRLDYTKGILQRFRAFDMLLEDHPELRGKVILVQIAPPSREDVPEYVEMRHLLEAAAGEINGRHAEFDYVPIRYLNKGFPRPVLAGFLRAAHIGLITPMRDGMNLVAKEFVAAQDPADPGVLVLSRFAGAAKELDGAILVNPYDEESISRALARALQMGREERVFRWHPMFQHLVDVQVTDWFQSFMDVLDKTRQFNPKVREDFA
jgi:trehalose 6-phosphate synthase